MSSMLAEYLHKELKRNIDRKYKASEARLFKEGINRYGVRTPIVRKIAWKYYLEIFDKKKEIVFGLSKELLSSGLHEPLIIAFDWAYRVRKQFSEDDFPIFRYWLKTYVNNWSACDDFCQGPLGELIIQYPGLLPKVFDWTQHESRWFRRASAVALIPPIRKANILPNVYKTAKALLEDHDDLVQKGYGWMLKEASNQYPQEIFDFAMRHKAKMPRTALRYAIEKLPVAMKKKAMSRGGKA